MPSDRQHRRPTPPDTVDLEDLATRSRIPLATLKRYWMGIAPTYFTTLRIQYHTGGRVTPEHFRRFLKPTGRRPDRTSFHGEAIWGTPLGQRLALIIIESGETRPKSWFEKNDLKPQTFYSMLMNGHVPRRHAVEQLARATNQQITIREIYDPAWPTSQAHGKNPRAAA